MDKNGLGEYQTMISRHFLIIYNPFWRSSDFLDTFGPSRSVCRSRSKDFPPILSFFLDPQKYLKHSGFKWLESAKMYSLDVISQKISNKHSSNTLNFHFWRFAFASYSFVKTVASISIINRFSRILSNLIYRSMSLGMHLFHMLLKGNGLM